MVSSVNFSSLDLELSASLVTSDSRLFGIPTYAIEKCRVPGDIRIAKREAFEFFSRFAKSGSDVSAIFTARISTDNTLETELLQQLGFRFRELSLHPRLDIANVSESEFSEKYIFEPEIIVEKAVLGEEILDIANSCFQISRFHREPLISDRLANLRFRNWLQQAIEEPRNQDVVQLKIGEKQIIGFFVRNILDNDEVNWQLTGLDPEFQSQGLGKAVWAAMVGFEIRAGMKSIISTISAENFPVVGMYPRFGFKFVRSSAVFHLAVRSSLLIE